MPSADSNIKTYLVLSPHLSQSISCAKRMIANQNLRVTGAYLPDEDPLLSPQVAKYYDNIIVLDSLDNVFDEYDCVIPSGASSTKAIFEYTDTFRCGDVHLNKCILQSSDKLKILELAESLGISVPETWNHFEDIPGGNMPIFYKPKYEGTPGARSWVACRDQVSDAVRNGNYLFQEKIEGPGVYGYGFVANKGNIITSFIHHEILSYPVDGGSAAVIRPYQHKLLDEYSTRLVKALSYSGWGLVEYKWCPLREDFVLMEINAKLWASIELAFLLNPDFSQLMLSTTVATIPVRGLIWPDRFFKCGVRAVWSARKYLIQYDYVYESVTIRRIVNKIKKSIFDR